MRRSCQRRLDAHNNRRQQQNRVFGFHRRRRLGAKPKAAGVVVTAAAQQDSAEAEEAVHAAAESGSSGSAGGGGCDGSEQYSSAADVGDRGGATAVEPTAEELHVGTAPAVDLSAVAGAGWSLSRCLRVLSATVLLMWLANLAISCAAQRIDLPLCTASAGEPTPAHVPAAPVPGRNRSKSASMPSLWLAGCGVSSMHSMHSPRPWKRRSSAGDVGAAAPDAAVDVAAAGAAAELLLPPAKRLCSRSESSVDQVQHAVEPDQSASTVDCRTSVSRR